MVPRLLLSLLFALVVAAAPTSSSSCNKYVIISVRGTYELQGPSIAFYGMINSTLSNVTGGTEYDAVYPASPAQTAYLGAQDVVAYINNGLATCPFQKYALLGYSQGASAVALALQNYTNPFSPGYNAIKAVLVVGNPFHKPNETVNIDQNGGDTTRNQTGILYPSFPDQHIPAAWYSSGKLVDICYQQDLICGPQYPGAAFIPYHLFYGGSASVQDIGAKFLVQRLRCNLFGIPLPNALCF